MPQIKRIFQTGKIKTEKGNDESPENHERQRKRKKELGQFLNL